MPLVYNKRNYVMAKTLTEHDQSSYSTISRYKPPFRLAYFSSRRYMVILSIKFLYLKIKKKYEILYRV